MQFPKTIGGYLDTNQYVKEELPPGMNRFEDDWPVNLGIIYWCKINKKNPTEGTQGIYGIYKTCGGMKQTWRRCAGCRKYSF